MANGFVPYILDHTHLDETVKERNIYKCRINPNIFAENNNVTISLKDFNCFNNQYNINNINSIYIECENLTRNPYSNRKILNVVNIGTYNGNSANLFDQKFHLNTNNIVKHKLDNIITNELIIKITDMNGNPLNISNLYPQFIFNLYG